MLNGRILNPRDIILIAIVVIAAHALLMPLYNLLDNSAASPDPS